MMTMLFGPVKALFQGLVGDGDGASQTIDEFTRTNPFIFPLRATADLILDGPEEFEKTCKAFGGAIDNMANSTPLVGHVKGVITAVCGDIERGREIYLQATRSTAVAATGVGGFFLGGPVAAAVLAAEAGTAWDVTRAASGGQANGVAKIIKAIKNNENISSGDFFDSITTPLIDCASGVAAAETFYEITKDDDIKKVKSEVKKKNTAKQQQFNKLKKEVSAKSIENSEEVRVYGRSVAPDNVVTKTDGKLPDLQVSVKGKRIIASNKGQVIKLRQKKLPFKSNVTKGRIGKGVSSLGECIHDNIRYYGENWDRGSGIVENYDGWTDTESFNCYGEVGTSAAAGVTRVTIYDNLYEFNDKRVYGEVTAKAGVGYLAKAEAEAGLISLEGRAGVVNAHIKAFTVGAEGQVSFGKIGGELKASLGEVSGRVGPIEGTLGLNANTGAYFGIQRTGVKINGTGAYIGTDGLDVSVLGSSIKIG